MILQRTLVKSMIREKEICIPGCDINCHNNKITLEMIYILGISFLNLTQIFFFPNVTVTFFIEFGCIDKLIFPIRVYQYVKMLHDPNELHDLRKILMLSLKLHSWLVFILIVFDYASGRYLLTQYLFIFFF